MKKLFLFIAVSSLLFSLNSCTNSDSSRGIGGSITMKINGVSKTYYTVAVNQQIISAGTANEYKLLTVIGTVGANTTEIITFNLVRGDVGSDVVFDFTYQNGTSLYFGNSLNGFISNVTLNNSGNQLNGNFAGELVDNLGNPSGIVLSEGAFDVQY